MLLLLTFSGGLQACNDLSKLAGSQPLPVGAEDPSKYNTPAGAIGIYEQAMAIFQSRYGNAQGTDGSSGAFVDFVTTSGVLTDELQAGNFGGQASTSGSSEVNGIDARQLPSGGSVASVLYAELNNVRAYATLGIGALEAYDDTAPPSLRGQLYGLQGYTEVFLADLFCSGIPLSTLDFNGNYTYHAGSTTLEVYSDAIFKFDSALTLLARNDTLLNLTRVGKGRAWLAVGDYDSAAAAVVDVPVGFTYQQMTDWNISVFNINVFGTSVNDFKAVTVSDLEGGIGLPFRSNGDPRDSVQQDGLNAFGLPQYVPFKYGGATLGIAPITLADWIEAKLIIAEAALHNPTKWGNWLDTLNYLRANAPIPGFTQPNPTALQPLTDPGLTSPNPDSARVALLFRERAYWLFVTGHRQGDLRRLIRQYSKNGFSAAVYPTGIYPLGGSILQYGNYVNIPVPNTELVNQKYSGCISRGA